MRTVACRLIRMVAWFAMVPAATFIMRLAALLLRIAIDNER